MYYVVGEEESIVVVRNGDIVYVQLVQDKLDGGLEIMNRL